MSKPVDPRVHVIRDRKGRFTPGGAVANPAGRPKGEPRATLSTTVRRMAEAEGLTFEAAQQVLAKALLDAAKRGDGTALRLAVDRLFPTDAEQEAERQRAEEQARQAALVGPPIPTGEEFDRWAWKFTDALSRRPDPATDQ